MSFDIYRRDQPPPDEVPAAAPAAGNFDVYKTGAAPSQAIPGVTPAPPAPPDKYRQAAIADRERFIKAGAENVLPEGYTARLGKGVGLGWTDELLAAGATPIEMIRRGVNPAEAYRYAKATQDLATEKTMEKTQGPLGMGAEIIGGLGTGAGAFSGTRAASPAWNYGRNVLKGGAIGTAAGAGEGNTFDERFQGAKMGGIIGAGAGAVLPPVFSAAGAALRPFKAIPHLRDPEVIAAQDVAKVAKDSGVPIEEAIKRVTDARAAGQTEYTLADAFGHAGERKLAGIAKVPGPAREQITETLANRGINMPVRTGAELARGLGATGTAEQETQSLIRQASREAAPLYRQAESKGPIWNNVIEDIFKTKEAKAGLAEGVHLQRIRNAGTGRPFDPNDAAIVGFDKAGDPILGAVPNMQTINTLKIGLDRMIEKEIDTVTGKMSSKGAALTGMKNRLLEQVDAMNPAYAEARRVFREPMQITEAVQQGREMASRGLAQDTIPAFRALSPAEQQGARVGYATAVREPMERTGNFPTILRGKSQKGAQELEEMSLYQGPRQPGQPDQLRQFLNREEQMQRTSNAARGGSSTTENIADVAGGPGGAEVLGLGGAIASGSPTGMARSALEIAQRYGRGENEAQRNAITRILLENEPDAMRKIADRLAKAEERRRGVNPWTGGYRYRP